MHADGDAPGALLGQEAHGLIRRRHKLIVILVIFEDGVEERPCAARVELLHARLMLCELLNEGAPT